MRSRVRNLGVFSLSAIDLFASAMGAFIIITIILMPDYQKEVRLEGHLEFIEALARQSEAMLNESEDGVASLERLQSAAEQRREELQAEEEIISSELQTLKAVLQASAEQPPPPATEEDEVEDETPLRLVTFRFLGLKTEKTRYLLMIDMNKYLTEHEELVEDSVRRALESLQPGFEFALLGFQQLDSGPVFHRWPESGELVKLTRSNRGRAMNFVRGLAGRYGGASPLLTGFREAFKSPAEAIILFSDGLPNPAFNDGLPPRALAQQITLANSESVEIHAVTIGDYFKYRGTVEFMESLARSNSGGFLALAQ